ncbi:TRAP transporter large permease [Salinicola sp. 4072]|uniref:TRAP transporter large permease n=1 Tax=Salinicola sp. 4072 TaxID=3082157 RepID=UPI002FCA0E1B
MDWLVTLLIFFGALIGLMATGINVFIAFLVVNLSATMVMMGPRGYGMFVNSVGDSMTTMGFVTIPLFILMGEILFRSGSVDVLFNSVNRLVGKIKGRLYVVVLLLATIFGALSGAAVAVSAMLGRSVLPNMESRGYSPKMSASVILAGASLAPIIPPSLLAIIIGSLANVSIAGLLIAGIVPGIIISCLTGAYIFLSIKRNASIAPSDEQDEEDKEGGTTAGALLKMIPFMFVVFMVMGMIMLGIATPTESAATGVLGAILVAIFYNRASVEMFSQSLTSSVKLSAMIMIIIASSSLFSQLVSFTGASQGLVNWATGLGLDPIVMFIIMMIIPVILCMFIDQIAFILMAVPLYQPLVAAQGFDPIWFWTILLINLTVGGITPPFGYTLFALSAAAPGLTVSQVFRASFPVLLIFLLSVVLMTAFPNVVTWLPGIM